MPTILKSVRVINGVDTHPLENAFVAIERGKIQAVGRSAEYVQQPGDTVFPFDHSTVLPGLFDVHIHVYTTGKGNGAADKPPKYAHDLGQLICAENLRAHLRAGFTTVRDVGSENDPIWALRHAERAGWIPAPRLLASGKLLTVTAGHGTEYGVDMAWECDGMSDLIKGIRRQQAEGADFIKVIGSRKTLSHPEGLPSWPVEELRAAVKEAHALGLRVAAHVSGAPEPSEVAVEAGVDSLEHGWGIREATMEKAGQKGIFLVPTLSVFASLAKVYAEGRSRYPQHYLGTYWGSMDDRIREVQMARDFGVLIVTGTDAGNPDTYHGSGAKELELLVQVGLSPLEAIFAATTNSAKLCGLESETGSIAPGKAADLLVVDGDPLSDIKLLQDPCRIQAVFKAGELVSGILPQALRS